MADLKTADKTTTNCVLTQRKLEYLTLAGLGFSNSEIAQSLSVTRFAVKKTFENIYKNLNAVNRTNAVLIASLHKLISSNFCIAILNKYPAARELYKLHNDNFY